MDIGDKSAIDDLNRRWSRCAVVGSSSALTVQSFGAEIDAHDCVVRANVAPTIGYEGMVGTRTTLRFGVTPKGLIESAIQRGVIRPSVDEGAFVARYAVDASEELASDHFRFASLTMDWEKLTSNLTGLSRAVSGARVEMSNGMASLLWAAAQCDHVTAYGFSEGGGLDAAHYYFRQHTFDQHYDESVGFGSHVRIRAHGHARVQELNVHLQLALARRVVYRMARAHALVPAPRLLASPSLAALLHVIGGGVLGDSHALWPTQWQCDAPLCDPVHVFNEHARSRHSPEQGVALMVQHPLRCCSWSARGCLCTNATRAYCEQRRGLDVPTAVKIIEATARRYNDTRRARVRAVVSAATLVGVAGFEDVFAAQLASRSSLSVSPSTSANDHWMHINLPDQNVPLSRAECSWAAEVKMTAAEHEATLLAVELFATVVERIIVEIQ